VSFSFEPDQFDGRCDTGKRLLASLNRSRVHKERSHHLLWRQNLIGTGEIAQSSRKVDSLTNVIVTFEENHTTGGHSSAKRHRRLLTIRFDHLDHSLDDRFWLDAHQHRTVAQPFRDPYAVNGCQSPNIAADRLQEFDRSSIAFAVGEGGESGDIDERERALHTRYSTSPHDIAHFFTILSS
jgi:hypothetical protein